MTYKENYGTKNNDLTFGIKIMPLYKYKDSFEPSNNFQARIFISLIDENGQPAKIRPVSSLLETFDTAKNLITFLDIINNDQEQSFSWELYDIPNGHYTLFIDDKKNDEYVDINNEDKKEEYKNENGAEEKNIINNNTISKELEKVIADSNKLDLKLSSAETQIDMNTISGEIYELWENEINDIWKRIKEINNPEDQKQLLQEERDWIKEKDNRLNEIINEYNGSSYGRLTASIEATNITKERVFVLAKILANLTGESTIEIEELKNNYFENVEKENIIKEWLYDFIYSFFGDNAMNVEIKYLNLISIKDDDIRFSYIIGEKLDPNKINSYYEDYVKGYIDSDKFYRNLSPVFDSEDRNNVNQMKTIWMNSSDIDKLNTAIYFEDYENGRRDYCGEGKYLLSRETSSLSLTKEELGEAANYVTHEWPQFRMVYSEKGADEFIEIKEIAQEWKRNGIIN